MGRLTILPCLDSEAMAAARRQELDIPRHVAAGLGLSADKAGRDGFYVTEDGRRVDWRASVEEACLAKRSIPPEEHLPPVKRELFTETRVQVANETTLSASRALVDAGHRPLALNFANGTQPGGGFLGGARAQEEVLCRSSALYQTLLGDPMYQEHRKQRTRESSDWAIYSPDVPVFRLDSGTTLSEPWLLSVITCAAPQARSIGQAQSSALLRTRIHRVLEIAVALRYTTLVLGAWGCGAFGNDPWQTAVDFRQALETDYRGAFSDIVFAITDWSAERRTLNPFQTVFSQAAHLGKPHL